MFGTSLQEGSFLTAVFGEGAEHDNGERGGHPSDGALRELVEAKAKVDGSGVGACVVRGHSKRSPQANP